MTTPKKSTSRRPQRRDTGVQVLDRAADILKLLTASPAGLTQAEVASALDLARSTTHRLLNALASAGLVEPFGAAGRYRLGPEVLRMADAARASLITEVHPLLQALSREIEETVDLAVLDKDMVTFIDQVVAPQRLRTVSGVGLSFPLHCTANGKAILASLSDDHIARLLPERLPALTPNTTTSHQALRSDLISIRKRGYAVDDEEHSLGICALGAAIGRTPLGEAAISIPIPVQRFAEKRKQAATALLRAARQISTFWTPLA